MPARVITGLKVMAILTEIIFIPTRSNFFNTRSNNVNKGFRPNFRVNMDYDLNKFNSVNVVLQLNSADTNSESITEYTNINRFGDIYRLSERHDSKRRAIVTMVH